MSNDNQLGDKLRCYFFGAAPGAKPGASQRGSYGFAIPDLGIVYKDSHFGTVFECQYNGLLSLLRFIDNNRKNFRGIEFEILSDAAVVVYHLNHQKSPNSVLRRSYNKVIAYKSRIAFTASWVPRTENLAIVGLHDSPPFHPDLEIKFEDKRYSDIDRMGKGQMLP